MSDPSTSVATQATSAADLIRQRESVSTNLSNADQQFWKDVFDHASGIGLNDQAGMPSGDEALTSKSQGQSIQVAQDSRLSGGPRVAIALGPNALNLGGDSMPIPVAAAVKPVLFGGGLVLASLAVDVPDIGASGIHLAPDKVEQALSPTRGSATAFPGDGVESTLGVHVMQTASGNWQVSLRAKKGLSSAQALTAAAQAIRQDGAAGQGQIEHITLNGLRIYEQADPSGNSPTSASIFELRC